MAASFDGEDTPALPPTTATAGPRKKSKGKGKRRNRSYGSDGEEDGVPQRKNNKRRKAGRGKGKWKEQPDESVVATNATSWEVASATDETQSSGRGRGRGRNKKQQRQQKQKGKGSRQQRGRGGGDGGSGGSGGKWKGKGGKGKQQARDYNPLALKNRRWKGKKGRGASVAGAAFTVMSFNILSDDYTSKKYLPTISPKHKAWSHRTPLIEAMLVKSNFDIYCLQEVNPDVFEDLLTPAMAGVDYLGHYIQRTGGKPDGCAIFVNANKFAVVETREIEYNTIVGVEDRDNVAQIVLLEDLTSGQQLVVANTHLLFNPKRGDLKFLQLQALLSELLEFEGLPVLLAGDFNFYPDSALYNYAVDGVLSTSGVDHRKWSGQVRDSFNESMYQESSAYTGASHNLGLSSAYRDCGGDPQKTAPNGVFAGTVDFIFYTTDTLQAQCVVEVPRSGKLPSFHHPSDHINIAAAFQYVDA